MIRVAQPAIGDLERQYLLECLERNQLSGGEFVERFEDVFASWIGVRHAVACSSGTAALHLALLAAGIGPGDEVIVPDMTFVATANAVAYCGAKPILVDVCPLDWTIDPELVAAAVTSRTRAIIPVHLYGYPANMDALQEIANQHGLFLVEDAAQAHGSTYNGRMAGSIGDLGCFSFYGNKTIATGEGGMVTTNNASLAARLRLLRGQGQAERRYWHEVIGYNYRMTELQAAIGLGQMAKADDVVRHRREIARQYSDSLAGQLYTQQQRSGSDPVPWVNVVLIDDRDDVAMMLADRGIETRPAFHSLHTLPMYKRNVRYMVADMVAERGLCLPTHGAISASDVRMICAYIT